MNLIHRIQRTMPNVLPSDTVAIDITEVFEISKTILKGAKEITHLEQLEAKWYPIVTPPYKSLWLEITNAFHALGSKRLGNAGFFLLTEDIEPGSQHEFKAYPSMQTLKWRTTIMPFLDMSDLGIRRAPATVTFFIHANGRIALYGFKLTQLSLTPRNDAEVESEMDALFPAEARFIILHALALMHCKNIHIIEQPLPRQQRRQLERRNIVPVVIKTLAIRPSGLIRQSTPGFNRLTRLMRHHLVRGHFKTFTPEAPLLGKHVGTYWWESSVRGHSEKGEVKKSYKVYPRTDEDNV